MAAMAFLQHYLEYLSSPVVLLSCLIVVVPVLLSVAAERAAAPIPISDIPGCRRLGLVGRSNLDAQILKTQTSPEQQPRVKALFTYPIKSCRGVELAASEVEASGLRYDRLFTFAQLVSQPDSAANENTDSIAEPTENWNHQWRFITQREFPRLALLKTELWVPDPRTQKAKSAAIPAKGNSSGSLKATSQQPLSRRRTRGSTLMGQLERGGRRGSKIADSCDWSANGGCLVVRFPFEPDYNLLGLRTEIVEIRLPLSPTPHHIQAKQYGYEEIVIWKDRPLALNVTSEIDPDALAKLKYFLGASNPIALFRVNDGNKRAVTRSLPKEQRQSGYHVGFADAFPTNLMSLSSVTALEEKLPAKSASEGKLDARRFRANIYLSGSTAFAEDSWKMITVGRRIGRNQAGLFEVDAEYHVACRTARCKLPNVDPNTGMRDKNEPYSTMARTRQVDEGALPHPCRGVQMIPLFERGLVKVGDEVRVLETGEHRYDKMFA